MVTRWSTVLLVLLPMMALAQDDAKRATELVAEMQYPQALKLVNKILKSPQAGPEQLKTAYQVQGLCLAVQGKAKRAVEAFRRLLAIDPAYRLPASVSPKLRPPFEQALKLSQGKPAITLTHNVPKPPKTLAELKLQVTLPANPFKLVGAVRMLYWAPDQKRQWSGAKVKRAGPLTLMLPKTLKAKEIEYYFEATNKHGGVLLRAGSRDEPFKLSTVSAVQVAAQEKTAALPVATRPEQAPPKADPPKRPLVAKTEVPDVTKTVVIPPADEKPDSGDEQDDTGAWYTSWWFWTGVGVVVAGVATGVVLGVSGSEPSGDIEYRVYLR